jgi:hypothetical protein
MQVVMLTVAQDAQAELGRGTAATSAELLDVSQSSNALARPLLSGRGPLEDLGSRLPTRTLVGTA